MLAEVITPLKGRMLCRDDGILVFVVDAVAVWLGAVLPAEQLLVSLTQSGDFLLEFC